METKNKLTKLVKAVLETDPDNDELLYLGPSYWLHCTKIEDTYHSVILSYT